MFGDDDLDDDLDDDDHDDDDLDDEELYEPLQLTGPAIAEALRGVSRPGDYVASGLIETPIPRLSVQGVGPIAFPLLPVQAEQLRAVAERAPYGRGADTLVDPAVRRTWQISPDRLTLTDPRWGATLGRVVEAARRGLGVEGEVRAELYKLLLYDEGAFFVEHRDTEKSPGMFATLVVVLPSLFEGGALVVRHTGRERRLSLGSSDPGVVSFAAFYADCKHELEPVTRGWRLALVYNLVRPGAGGVVAPDERVAVQAVADALRGWEADPSAPGKLVWVLEHCYSSAELSWAALKGQDAARAGVLRAAAAEAGVEVHLSMICIDESGWAQHTGRWGRDDPEEFEVGEVDESRRRLEGWRDRDDRAIGLGELPLDDDEIWPADALEGVEPDEVSFSEATGNEGASFERAYRVAAVVLWPGARRYEILAAAGAEAAVPLLAERVAAGEVAEAIGLADALMSSWIGRRTWRWTRAESPAAVALDALVRLGDAGRVERFLREVMGRSWSKGDEAAVLRALPLLSQARAAVALHALVSAGARDHFADMAGLAGALAALPDAAQGLGRSTVKLLARVLVEAAPVQLTGPEWSRKPVPAEALAGLVRAAARGGEAEVIEVLAAVVLGHPEVYPMDETVIPALLAAPEAATPLRALALALLDDRLREPLAPYPDLARPAEVGCACEDCAALARFLRDPVRARWELKAAKQTREHVEARVKRAALDLDLATVTRGSPHTLVCTKNSASYDRKVAQRARDLAWRRVMGG